MLAAALNCLAIAIAMLPAAHLSAAHQASSANDEVLFQASFSRASNDPLELRLVRIELEAGGLSPRHTHPGLEFGVIESGSLVVRVTGAALRRAADLPADAESEVIPEGVEVTLGVGDRVAYAPETEMTFRNPGPGPTTLLAATVLPTGDDAPPGAVFPGGAPSADDVAGVQSRIVGSAVVDDLPEGQLVIALERLMAESGDVIPGFPGPVLVAVEAGGLSGSVLEGAVELPSARTVNEENGDPNDDAALFTVGPGEAFFFPAGVAETAPLGGEGTVDLLRLGVVAVPEETPQTVIPTSPPTATASAAVGNFAPGSTVIVLEDETRLRAGPSLDSEVVNGFDEGRRLRITGDPVAGPEYLWYPVEDPDDPTIAGYVAGDLLDPAE